MHIQSLAANQTVVTLSSGCEVFFSYETPVAAIFDGVSYKSTYLASKRGPDHMNGEYGRRRK